ncbi:transposable element Tcb2 transposase [Trichonephila clavipes]|nr:transposable element Tcb2 transposase [Trichonephila clavipes]
MGFRSRNPTRAPLLTARRKALHLAWAHQHRQSTVGYWKHFAWFDEFRFQFNRADGRVRRDMGPLIRLDTTLTGDRHVSILSDHLSPFMSIVHSDGFGEFQQDNATPHVQNCYRVGPGALF